MDSAGLRRPAVLPQRLLNFFSSLVFLFFSGVVVVCDSFAGQAKILDMGRGRLRKAVEDVRVEGVPGEEGTGVLHMAASHGHMEMCKYLVETLQVDVDDADDKGPYFFHKTEPEFVELGLWSPVFAHTTAVGTC